MKKKMILFFLLLILLSSFSLKASASIFYWNVYESDDFVIFYPEGYKYQAEEVLYYLDKYQQDTMELVGNENNFKTLVVLQDAGLDSNGLTTADNYKINIYTNNPSTLSRIEGLESYNSWFKQLTIHEMTHLAQISNATGAIGKIADIGGIIYSPNYHTPTWMKEGIAVYNESRYSDYEGRLNNGYYESFIASTVKNKELPDLLEVPYNRNQYIYGSKLIDYLANNYGEEKVTEFFEKYSGNFWAIMGSGFPALGIDNTANKVFGKSFPELFDEWKEYEKNKYEDWKIEATEIEKNDEGKILKLTKYKDKLY